MRGDAQQETKTETPPTSAGSGPRLHGHPAAGRPPSRPHQHRNATHVTACYFHQSTDLKPGQHC